MSKRPPPSLNRTTSSESSSNISSGKGNSKVISIKNFDITKDHSNTSKKPIWKEYGEYLASLDEINSNNNLEQSSSISSKLSSLNPLSQSINYKICKSCQRPISINYLNSHIESCLEMKTKEKSQPQPKSNGKISPKKRKNEALYDTKESTPNHNSPLSSTDVATPTTKPERKKYKKSKDKEKEKDKEKDKEKEREKEKEKEAKKAKKEKVKPVPKVKGPVDVEKQCGVPIPNGGFCARSLTCKTHSMGAKRAVPGRSAPYDQLLAAYQRKNQAKLAAGQAQAQALKEDLVHGGNQPLDADEETQQVLEGLSKNLAFPLERKTIIPCSVRNRFLRMREMFAGAILPRSNNGIGALNGRTALIDVSRANEQQLYSVRAPFKYIPPHIQAQQVQQQVLLQQQQLQAQQSQKGHAQSPVQQ